MKRILQLLIIFGMASDPSLLAQNKNKDSIESAEMRRLNRMGDSLHQTLLAHDSIRRAEMNELLLKTKRDIAEQKSRELSAATKEVLARQEKTHRFKRKTLLLAGAAFAMTLLIAAMVSKRRRLASRQPK